MDKWGDGRRGEEGKGGAADGGRWRGQAAVAGGAGGRLRSGPSGFERSGAGHPVPGGTGERGLGQRMSGADGVRASRGWQALEQPDTDAAGHRQPHAGGQVRAPQNPTKSARQSSPSTGAGTQVPTDRWKQPGRQGTQRQIRRGQVREAGCAQAIGGSHRRRRRSGRRRAATGHGPMGRARARLGGRVVRHDRGRCDGRGLARPGMGRHHGRAVTPAPVSPAQPVSPSAHQPVSPSARRSSIVAPSPPAAISPAGGTRRGGGRRG